MLGFYAEYGVNGYKNAPMYSPSYCKRSFAWGVNGYKNAPMYSVDGWMSCF
jgi:hypothetical protein